MAKSNIAPTSKKGSFTISLTIPPSSVVVHQETIGSGWTHGFLFIRNLEYDLDFNWIGGQISFDTTVVSIGDADSYSRHSKKPSGVVNIPRPRIFWNSATGGNKTTDDFLGGAISTGRYVRIERVQIIGDILELELRNRLTTRTEVVNAAIRYRLFNDPLI